ncbi:aromatic compound dioxygenase [Thelephora ganbajun]|uniref:Aromatic compound dioxygenase n=1 Tax=Thelephora ganbajun TaxID=370292 RepID=A0ACB6ZSM9_THEGA|nr:aromatic compound dioxygenase [Thelephora ganbajun]
MAQNGSANGPQYNGIPAPNLDLPWPESPETITENLLRLTQLAENPRTKFIFSRLITHLHQFVEETSLTTEEWMTAINFLTRTGQICSPIRQEFILLSDVLGVSALVDGLNNPTVSGGTTSSVLGPFYTEDAPDVNIGDSIASEGKGEHMYVEGRVLDIHGKPVPNACIETWETDSEGFYDTQYSNRTRPDCRGKLRCDDQGRYGYRAVVPVAYAIPGDGPVGELLLHLNRHNMRPNHLHVSIEAPGYRELVTALYPQGDKWLSSDAVFGVKSSLVVGLKDIDDEEEARRRGFPKGKAFKLLQRDFVLVPSEEAEAVRQKFATERAKGVR